MVADEEKWGHNFDIHKARLEDMFDLDLQNVGLEPFGTFYEKLWELYNTERPEISYSNELRWLEDFDCYLTEAGEDATKELFMTYMSEELPLNERTVGRYVVDLDTVFHPRNETADLHWVDLYQVHELGHAIMYRLVDVPEVYLKNYRAVYEGDGSVLAAANAEVDVLAMMKEGFPEYIALNAFEDRYALPDMQVWIDARKARHLKAVGEPVDTIDFTQATGYDYDELMSNLTESLNHEYGYLYYALQVMRGKSLMEIVMHPPESVEELKDAVHEALEKEGFEAFLA